MGKPPTRRPTDPREAAEAAFRRATAPVPAGGPARAVVPGVRQLVSLRIDEDVLEDFQEGGPDWQERINAALRKAAFGNG